MVSRIRHRNLSALAFVFFAALAHRRSNVSFMGILITPGWSAGIAVAGTPDRVWSSRKGERSSRDSLKLPRRFGTLMGNC